MSFKIKRSLFWLPDSNHHRFSWSAYCRLNEIRKEPCINPYKIHGVDRLKSPQNMQVVYCLVDTSVFSLSQVFVNYKPWRQFYLLTLWNQTLRLFTIYVINTTGCDILPPLVHQYYFSGILSIISSTKFLLLWSDISCHQND